MILAPWFGRAMPASTAARSRWCNESIGHGRFQPARSEAMSLEIAISRFRSFAMLAIPLLSIIAGCGRPGLERFEVSGSVNYTGDPIEVGASSSFQSTAHKVPCRGEYRAGAISDRARAGTGCRSLSGRNKCDGENRPPESRHGGRLVRRSRRCRWAEVLGCPIAIDGGGWGIGTKSIYLRLRALLTLCSKTGERAAGMLLKWPFRQSARSSGICGTSVARPKRG